jgi:hypothetical protein
MGKFQFSLILKNPKAINLSCCGSFGLGYFTFIQIALGYAVCPICIKQLTKFNEDGTKLKMPFEIYPPIIKREKSLYLRFKIVFKV